MSCTSTPEETGAWLSEDDSTKGEWFNSSGQGDQNKQQKNQRGKKNKQEKSQKVWWQLSFVLIMFYAKFGKHSYQCGIHFINRCISISENDIKEKEITK